MSYDLFYDQPESISPREKWCRENRVLAGLTHGREQQMFGDYVAYTAGLKHMEYGHSRDVALEKLAMTLWKKEDVKPWYMTT